MRFLGLTAIFLFVATASAEAATIEKEPLGAGQPEIILVYGKLTMDDVERFRAVASGTPKAIVVLAGPGGVVAAGTQIGEVIRMRGYKTVVFGRHYCASACALAWLGGAARYMEPSAKIGFHAAQDTRSGEVSGFGNALVGAYLNRLGLPEQAIFYITAAGPREMTWLSPADARAFGIEVRLFSEEHQIAEEGTGSEDAASSQLEREAAAFVVEQLEIESAPPASPLRKKAESYAETVLHYGSRASREKVMRKHQAYRRRWPVRRYRLRPGTLSVECLTQTGVCRVRAEFDWQVADPRRGKQVVGASSWRLGLQRKDGSFVITSVDGDVLRSRRAPFSGDIPIGSAAPSPQQ